MLQVIGIERQICEYLDPSCSEIDVRMKAFSLTIDYGTHQHFSISDLRYQIAGSCDAKAWRI